MLLALLAFLSFQSVEPPAARPGVLVERVPCPSDPSQTYSVYLPSTYTARHTWPLLLVFDPGGRGARAAAVFRDAAERYGWIVAASENSRNGPWEPTLRAIGALWPALLGGYAVDPARVYAAGHSGGASVAWMLARQSGQIAGVIASGQPDPGPDTGAPVGFAWFGSAGYADFNYLQVKSLDVRVARAGRPHRVEFFDGGHQWPPADLTFRALAWLEVIAMKEKRRPLDPQLAAATLADDMAHAHGLEAGGLLTDARRAYGSIVDSYAGVSDVSGAESRGKALESHDDFKRARRAEERADGRERDQVAAIGAMLTRLSAADLPMSSELRDLLGLVSLQRASRGASYDAQSARRSLELIFVEVSTTVRRDFEAKRDFARAAIALELATDVHPERVTVWIDLAADRALSGARRPAIAALQRAVDAGFADGRALAADARLASLRGMPAFETLIQRMEKREPKASEPQGGANAAEVDAARRRPHRSATRSLATEHASMNAQNATSAAQAAGWLNRLWM